jgi:P27 family predicted phage terminase small subunit
MSRKLPIDEKARKGTLRPSREKPSPLAPLDAVPEPPAHLSNPAARAWQLFGSLMVDAGRLCEADSMCLEGAAQAYTDWRNCVDEIDQHGPNYEIKRRSPDGTIRSEWKPRPAVSQRNEADRRLRGWLQSLGLTPVDRTKVGELQSGPEENPWGDLLQ